MSTSPLDNGATDSSTLLLVDDRDRERLKRHQKIMSGHKKRKRSELEDEADEAEEERRQRSEVVPTIVSTNIDDQTTASTSHRASGTLPKSPAQHVSDIIQDMNLQSNEERLGAFNIIARHFLEDTDRLLMYLGGVGGMGKSHVISSVVQLLQRLGRAQELLLSAPTGTAAVLIAGSTIHSLTMLPQSSFNVDELMKIWRHVRYLFIDEISMVHSRSFRMLTGTL
jgi:hypothetical protein